MNQTMNFPLDVHVSVHR